MKRQMSRIPGIVALIAGFLLLGAGTVLAQQTATVSLNGFSHIPPVHTSGSGSVTLTIDENTLSLEGEVSDLTSRYTSAGIYYGSPRETGNQLIRLSLSVSESGRGGEFSREENSFELRPAVREALEEGNLYINVSTEKNSRGELRGQVPPLGNGQWEDREFFDSLDEQELTAPQ